MTYVRPDGTPELGNDTEPIPYGLTLDDFSARHSEVVGEEQVFSLFNDPDGVKEMQSVANNANASVRSPSPKRS